MLAVSSRLTMPTPSLGGLRAPVPTLASKASGKEVDASRIEFRVILEVQNDAAQMQRAIKGTNWSVSAITVRDCSHESPKDNGNPYVRVSSPMITVAGGGLDQITEVLGRLQKAGAVHGRTGAMRLYVKQDQLTNQGTTNLMKMVMANEDILYRLGQNGGGGRAIDHKTGYARSIADTIGSRDADWARELCSHGYGVNSETQGMWEFRFLDSSSNAPAVRANAQLLLGMVKAAAEGRVPDQTMHSVSNNYAKQVDRKRWNAFLNEVLGPGETKQQLEAQFRASGGQLEKEMLPPEARKAISQLMKQQYVFQDDRGQALGSLDALARQVEDDRRVQIVSPQGSRVTLPADKVSLFAYGETGADNLLGEGLRGRTRAAAALKKGGVEVVDADGSALSPTQAALLLDDGNVSAVKGGIRIPLGTANNRLGLEALAGIESGNLGKVPAHVRPMLEQMDFLDKHGFTLSERGGAPLQWRGQAASVFASGDMTVAKDGKSTAVPNWDTLQKNVIYPEKLAGLTADDRALLDQATALAENGYAFSQAGHDAPAPKSEGFVVTVLSDSPQLRVQMPGAANPTPLPSRNHLRLFAQVEQKQDGALDERTTRILDNEQVLRDKGYKFFNRDTEDEIKSRSGVSLTLSTKDQKLTMRAPGAKRRTRLTEKALDNIRSLEEGKPERMDPALRAAVERGTQLRDMGFGLQRTDIMKDGQWVDCNPAELIATVDRDRPVVLIDPAGNRSQVDGLDAFLAAADHNLQVGRGLTQPQTEALNTFQKLLTGNQIVSRATVNGEQKDITAAAQLPWMLARGEQVQINTPQDPRGVGGVQVRDWNGLQQFVTDETTAPQAGSGPNADVVRHSVGLRGQGVRFYYVQGKGKVDIGLNSALVQHLGHEGVKAQLPHWSFWKGLPRKNITINGPKDLERLAHKFGMQ